MIQHKKDDVKIINISAVQRDGYTSVSIYGLGDDGMVYIWNGAKTFWSLFN